jgi:hypothetical protein
LRFEDWGGFRNFGVEKETDPKMRIWWGGGAFRIFRVEKETDPKMKILRKTTASKPEECRMSSSVGSQDFFTHPAEGTRASKEKGCFFTSFSFSLSICLVK